MATFNDLKRLFSEIKKTTHTVIPRELANSMLRETQQNFRDQAYGNDGVRKPWPDRPHESELNYPKLMYTGKLYKSIKPGTKILSRHTIIAQLKSNNPTARIHQEGGMSAPGYGNGGMRRPPHSARKLFIGAKNIQRRPYMGFGSRSRKLFIQIINKELAAVMRR